MQIAFLNIYSGQVSRGAETAVSELASRFSKTHTVTVFQSGKKQEGNYNSTIINGIPIIPTDVSSTILFRIVKKIYCDPYNLLVLYFSLRCLPMLFSTSFDIYIPINGFWQIVICKLIKLFKGGKIVVMGYAGIGSDDYINLKLSPDAFCPMTHAALSWAKSINPNISMRVIPGGVDLQRFSPKATPIKLDLKHPVVLVVAALVPYKRVDWVIKAVSQLSDVSLVAAGDGPQKSEIESLGQILLGNRFHRISISYGDLPHLYAACDVFTLPSQHEGTSLFSRLTKYHPSEAFGIVYVEAMASGLPVVAPDDELRREIIGEAGILVDCENTTLYAEALDRALKKKWGSVPRMQAEKFDWENIAQEFSGFLSMIAARKHSV